MRPIAAHLNRRNKPCQTALLVCLLASVAPMTAQGQYALTWSAQTPGGRATGGSYALVTAVGSFATVDGSSMGHAPTPNPMQWETVPYATSSTSITMMAAEAQDPLGGIQYYFQNVTVSNHDSGWQDSRTYTDAGLAPDTIYQYRVKARGSIRMETAYSVQLPAKTEKAPQGSVPEGSAKPVSGELGNDLSLQVDPFTGSVSYTLPIAVPPGRQGSEPSLALRYGGGGNGWCGFGWSLGMGAIQRDTRKGVPIARSGGTFLNKYDDAKGFVVAFGAVNSRLVQVNEATHEYRAETDQAFLKYEYDASYDPNGLWTVTDKSGNKFYFGRMPGESGRTAGAAMRHPQFNSATKGDNVYLWALAKIQDINGNLTYVYYTQNARQLYLSEVRYNGHTQGLPTTSSVKFLLDPAERSDKSISYATGYRVETNKRLNKIDVLVYDYAESAWARVRQYALEYEQSPSTLRSLLRSVKMCGTGDPNLPASYLPPVTFEYQQKPFEFESPIDWGTLDSQPTDSAWNSPSATNVTTLTHLIVYPTSPPSYGYSNYYHDKTHVALCDLNGDGLPDRVLRNPAGFTPPNNVLKAQFNTGSGFMPLQNWGPIDAQGHTTDSAAELWNSPRSIWTDIYWATFTQYLVEWNPPDPPVYGYQFTPYMADDVPVDLLDINGDGLPDRVMRRSDDDFSPPNKNVLKVQFSTGTSYAQAIDWGPLYAFGHTICGQNMSYYDWRAIAFNSVGATYCGDCQPTLVCLVDMNHDGLPDRVLYDLGTTGDFKVQFNTGSGFESESGSAVVASWGPVSGQGSTEYGWLSPRTIDSGQETTIDLVDINGDGLPDRVMRKVNAPYNVFRVQFNTGCGFEKDAAGNPVLWDWSPVSGQGDTSTAWNSLQGVIKDSGTFFVDFFDINGDGLPDRVMRERTTDQGGNPSLYDVFKVQLNTGSGFQKVGENTPVLATWTGIDAQGAGTAPDWGSPHAVIHPQHVNSNTYVTMCDINGDGLPDRVMRKKDSPYDIFKVQLNKGPFPDLLSKVTGKLGGSVHVEYKSSTDPEKHKDSTGVNRLPFPVQVASLLDANDGFANHVLTQYDYARGFYDAARREFGGFGLTTIKKVRNGTSGLETIGTTTLMYFHQGGGYEDPSSGEWDDAGSVGKKGTPYRTEVYGNDGKLYKITTNRVEEIEVVADTSWRFAHIVQTTTVDYPGVVYTPGSHQYPSNGCRAKVQQWEYDAATGNLLKSIDLGEVTLGTASQDIATHLANHTYASDVSAEDNLYVHNQYATFANPAILNKIRWTKTTSDPDGTNRLAQSFYTYDSNGRVHTEVLWLDKDKDGPIAPEDANTASVEYTYDNYGNVAWSRDRAGIETTTTYDPNYHIFPVEKSTASFVTSTDFDIRSGLPVRTIDPAGMVAGSQYDSFFRLTDVTTSTAPNVEPTLWQTHIDYSLGGILGGLSHNYVHQVHEGYQAYIYSDGLGRIIQTRIKAETGAPHEYRVAATTYNDVGKISFQTLPFFGDGAAYAPAAGQAGTLTEYDPVGRVWKVTPPAGESGSPTGACTTVYGPGAGGDPWEEVFTDAEGKITHKYFDAAGRVVELVEPGSIHTYYEYDLLGRLVKTTDHVGHEFRAEYDSLDRKIRSIDPDMGTWTYAYDDAARMTDQVDARGNKVEFTYNDELGRVTQKVVKNSGQQVRETVTYTYDQSDDPAYTVHKGQVYKVADGQGWTKTGYDSRGRVIKSTRYLSANDKGYTTQTAYDAADRVTQITYPGTKAVIAHSYDTAGHLVRTESLWGTGANEVFYQASAFNEDGRLTVVTYGSGVSTQTEFYAATRRLKHTRTSTVTTNLQDITYTCDKVSNLKSVTDAIHSGTASCGLSNIQYDDLHRLVSVYSASEGRTLTYEYTAIGNINKNGEMGAGTYTYSPTQPHAVTAANGSSYSYDTCGNMITRNRSGQPNQTLTYDEQNRLTQVAITGGSTIQFGYAAGGARLWKKVNGEITGLWIGSLYEERNGKVLCHVYGGDRLVATFEPESGFACLIENNRYLAAVWHFGDKTLATFFGGGRTPVTVMWAAALTGIALGLRYNRRRLLDRYGLQTYYGLRAFGGTDPWRQMVLLTLAAAVFLSSNPQAAYAGTPVYDPVFYYYHPDHLGSSQVMTDRDGDVVQQYGYSPFGREDYKNNTQAFSVSSRYTAQTLDEETGLYYYGARYYDSELARFIQADSIVPAPASSRALNRYTYVYNNPLRLTDPTGNYPYDSYMTAASDASVGAFMGAVQAGMAGGDMLMGAYVGAINGGAGYNLIQLTNSNASALTSLLTGNTTSPSFTTDWKPYDFSTNYASPYEPIKPPDYSDSWGKPLKHDYASGPDTLASLEQIKAMEVVHTALDLAGSIDPTPTCDTLNAAIYAGEGRWWDAANSMLGTVSYFGDLAKGGRLGAKTLNFMDFTVGAGRYETKGIHYANDLGIQSFNQMYKYTAGTGLQRHHLIEQRFAANIDFGDLSQLSVAMTREAHDAMTQAWRRQIAYGGGTREATRESVLNAAALIYRDNPEILKALGL